MAEEGNQFEKANMKWRLVDRHLQSVQARLILLVQ